MEIPRTFAQGLKDPFSELNFVERSSRIVNADGSVVAEIDKVIVPETIGLLR